MSRPLQLPKSRMQTVSLGSSCSVAFQQQSNGLRSQSLPFDWLQTDSFAEVIKCLETLFSDFTTFDVNQKVRTSNNFPLFDADLSPFPGAQSYHSCPTRVIENAHQFRFCHDFNADGNTLPDQIKEVSVKYRRRIQRLQTLMKTQPLHFVRDELKPKTLTTANIKQFVTLMSELCVHQFHLTLIVANPNQVDYPIFKFRHSQVTIINDQSPWVDWQRSNFNWVQVFDVKTTEDANKKTEKITELSHKVNYRNKTCVNLFDADKKIVAKYNDTVSLPSVIDKVNVILNEMGKLSSVDQKQFNYLVIEKSSESAEYAVKFVMSGCQNSNLIRQLMAPIQSHFTIMAYQRQHGDSQLYQLTDNVYFQDTYEGTPWQHQIDSFIQPIPELSTVIHSTINSWILRDHCNFLGLSGEMGYYARHNLNDLSQVVLLSNKAIRTADCERNLGHVDQVQIHAVQYDQCQLATYTQSDPKNWILLINMSTGLQELRAQAGHLQWKQILYIGCKPKWVEQDLGVLLTKYQIHHQLKIKLPTGSVETLLDLRPITM